MEICKSLSRFNGHINDLNSWYSNLADPLATYTKLTQLVKTVFINLPMSAVPLSFWGSLQDPTTKLSIEQKTELIIKKPYCLSAIQSLVEGKQINSSAIIEYGAYLKEKHPNFWMVPDFVLSGESILQESKLATEGELGLPSWDTLLEKKIDYLAIPVVVQTTLGQEHLVTFLLDVNNKCMEFYDSQGLSVEDRGSQPLVKSPHNNLSSLSSLLFGIYENDCIDKKNTLTLKTNKYSHQADLFNCGPLVCRYYDLRLNKKLSLEEIDQSPFLNPIELRQPIIKAIWGKNKPFLEGLNSTKEIIRLERKKK